MRETDCRLDENILGVPWGRAGVEFALEMNMSGDVAGMVEEQANHRSKEMVLRLLLILRLIPIFLFRTSVPSTLVNGNLALDRNM